jgi:hypothetical protein
MANYNCRVCKSINKIEIEKNLSEGLEFREVAKKYLNEFDCGLHLLEQSLATHYKKHLNGIYSNELTPEDLELIERFKKGEVEFDEASRIIAAKAFEKILRNPGSIQVRDWLQSELIMIKKKELADQNNYATELMNRMFGGYLPPKNCAKCGNPFIQDNETKQMAVA